MAVVLGVNAVFHDPAAAIVVDGEVVAAAEEERFSRRKHGKTPVPFSTWELPEAAARWCLREAGVKPGDIDAVSYSYDPALARSEGHGDVTADEWEPLRTLYARRCDRFRDDLRGHPLQPTDGGSNSLTAPTPGDHGLNLAKITRSAYAAPDFVPDSDSGDRARSERGILVNRGEHRRNYCCPRVTARRTVPVVSIQNASRD